MKAFARIDGAMLSVMWVASFACYVVGLANPMFTMVAFVLMVITPFFVCKRLGKFRDEGRGGIISMGRGWAYSIFVFFYASILMALAQYVYFAYIDQGYLMLVFSQSLSTPEMQQMLEQAGLQKTVNRPGVTCFASSASLSVMLPERPCRTQMIHSPSRPEAFT